ncbi:hypothetical protein O3G_MSEX012423 [Manduca sexta]|uniref:Uncharacterized protein n=1 Tax=Manduca sexta TaxID=7130 RepID=A0A922CVI5_MANSE|nr:hypothetical protein O3G_MSEX012423 [Manduca sexta]
MKYPKFLTLNVATTSIQPKSIGLLPSQPLNATAIPLKCNRCVLKGVMLRAQDGTIANLDPSRYSLKGNDKQKFIEIELDSTKPQDFGDYFAIIQNEDGTEERVKALTVVCKSIHI